MNHARKQVARLNTALFFEAGHLLTRVVHGVLRQITLFDHRLLATEFSERHRENSVANYYLKLASQFRRCLQPTFNRFAVFVLQRRAKLFQRSVHFVQRI